jgi:hypothetical protein
MDIHSTWLIFMLQLIWLAHQILHFALATSSKVELKNANIKLNLFENPVNEKPTPTLRDPN